MSGDNPSSHDGDGGKADDGDKRLKELNETYRPAPKQADTLATFASAGIELGVYVALFTLGGWWLDKRLGSSPAFVLVGAAIGVTVGMYRMIRAFNRLMK
jgi:F0F1-type ATP synthase assembly protein I